MSIHKTLFQGRWNTLTLAEQLGNIGSEYMRFSSWKKKSDKKYINASFDRFIELLDLTIQDRRWKNRISEFLRLREVVCDQYLETEEFSIAHSEIENYFLPFAYISRQKNT